MSESCFWVVAKEERYENEDLLTRLAITFGTLRAGQSMLTLLCSHCITLYCVSIIKHLNRKTFEEENAVLSQTSVLYLPSFTFILIAKKQRSVSKLCTTLHFERRRVGVMRFHWQFEDPMALRGLVISSFHWLNISKTHKQMLKITNSNDLK